MIVDAQIRFKDILAALDVKSIPGCDDGPDDYIEFTDCVDIDECTLPDCDLCDGEGRGEPEDHALNNWLVRDFITAVRVGDIRTAQCLVGRVFELSGDVGEVTNAIADTHAKRGDDFSAPSLMSGGGAEGNRTTLPTIHRDTK